MSAALIVGIIVAVAGALLRAGAASLIRTPRADALHDDAEGLRGAGVVARLLEDRELLTPTINMVHAGLLVVAAVLGTWALNQRMRDLPLAAALVGWMVVLVIGADFIPRSVGRGRPRRLAYQLAPLLAGAFAVGSKASGVLREQHLSDATDLVQEEYDEDLEELELISSVLEFSETIVREVMVPRPDMVVIDATAGIQELMALIDTHGISRIPVVGEGLDDIRGLVIAKDLLPRFAKGDRPRTVEDVMRAIDFVPETKRVSDLLREMQASKLHMAIVVDEYGGTAGLVTIEDLLEELVGEIVDEYDEDELLVEHQPDGSWRVDGRLPVSELSAVIGAELPDHEWDTVGGLVLGLAGRVPVEGESFDSGAATLTVVRVQGRRVAEVEVTRSAGDQPLEDTG